MYSILIQAKSVDRRGNESYVAYTTKEGLTCNVLAASVERLAEAVLGARALMIKDELSYKDGWFLSVFADEADVVPKGWAATECGNGRLLLTPCKVETPRAEAAY